MCDTLAPYPTGNVHCAYAHVCARAHMRCARYMFDVHADWGGMWGLCGQACRDMLEVALPEVSVSYFWGESL